MRNNGAKVAARVHRGRFPKWDQRLFQFQHNRARDRIGDAESAHPVASSLECSARCWRVQASNSPVASICEQLEEKPAVGIV
jgi:hypothetical protein